MIIFLQTSNSGPAAELSSDPGAAGRGKSNLATERPRLSGWPVAELLCVLVTLDAMDSHPLQHRKHENQIRYRRDDPSSLGSEGRN